MRHISFGEGNYATTEKLIRELLTDANPDVQLPAATDVADVTPELGSTTRETFLGATKAVNFGGGATYRAGVESFSFPADQAADTFALAGDWEVQTQYATPASDDAQVRLNYHAREVRVVLAGSGAITVTDQSGAAQTIDVSGTPRSYELLSGGSGDAGQFTLTVPAGVQVYSFTFG
ncbi:hypothetical protein [Microbacterium sp. GXS0129]|uniref:hypothetical protein n=1 Tax=Microbacterium sp. GXS0129 TaxID=3377836 RepID=UPI00383A681A